MVFDKSVSDPANITISEDFDFLYRLFDRVMFENSYYFIFGRRKTGSFNIRDIDGKSQKNITYRNLNYQGVSVL